MHDCDNADIRDLLPDHAHGALAPAERARVDAHLATCAACRDELALLRSMRAARRQAPPVDVARVVAALPRPSAPVAGVPSGVVPLDARRRGGGRALPWRRVAGVAALFVGVVGVGLYGRNRGDGRNGPAIVSDPVVVADSPDARPRAGSTPLVPSAPDVSSATATPRPPAPRGGGAEALGGLGGIASGATDDELEALIGGLESLSGIPDVEGAEGEESTRIGGGER